MICPHCEKNLLRKERPDNTCSHCRRTYALDPKTNSLGLSDLRVRRILAKVTEEGRIAVVPDQLWYALSRKRLKESRFAPGCASASLGAGLFVGFFAIVAGITYLLLVSGALLLAAAGFAFARAAGVSRGFPVMSRAAFRSEALAPWRNVYGGLPPGVVDDSPPVPSRAGVRAPSEAQPAAVLLCPDRSITAFLVADGLPARYGIAPAEDLDAVRALPTRGPVIVLHDADAHGELLVRQVRECLGQRTVIDAGLPLRTVRRLAQAVPYRDKQEKPDRETMARLTALGEFTEEELKWLGKGWRFPLVGMPPARLLAAVTRVAEQVTRSADPERRRAASVGFMTWPGPAAQDHAGER
ncbi:hypothetical protein GCM10010207_80930 [Streptomyces atratus]|uniref:hypothetical protein n=1 Tax=Streptomyces atratus TaxID=1893 RepID=UPI001670FE69|nr:hypothetical protein [Streptomyces atratus]GGT70381.1 hypothetical protein GCM10010207_80930 [Streptomyces atratus]